MHRALAFTAIVVAACASARVAEAQVRVATVEKPAVALDLYGWVSPLLTVTAGSIQTPVPDEINVQFSVPQARLGAVATLGRWGRMQTELDLAPLGGATLSPPTVLDAYVVLTPHRSRVWGVDVTLGRFRVPISRQNLIQPFGLQTPELGKYILDTPNRQMGGMLGVDFLDREIRLLAGVFNGGWGAVEPPPSDPPTKFVFDQPWLLYAGRIELQPLGPAPSFEGDVRPVSQRRKPVLLIGASVLRTSATFDVERRGASFDPGNFTTHAIGADVGFWYAGASFHGEFYYRLQDVTLFLPTNLTPVYTVHSFAANAQLGYFLPFGLLREHLEIALQGQFVERRGYPNIVFAGGANVFFDRGHRLKTQLFYENTTSVWAGDDLRSHRVMLQATAGF
ncbi:MAG TPA: hypothetical protein VM694_00500 [Polyangium sp.]|nr:hypothetical protein [Polyangium sp.]